MDAFVRKAGEVWGCVGAKSGCFAKFLTQVSFTCEAIGKLPTIYPDMDNLNEFFEIGTYPDLSSCVSAARMKLREIEKEDEGDFECESN